MFKRMIIVLLIFGLVVGGIAYYKYSQIRAAMAQPHGMPPTTVTSAVVQMEMWENTTDVIGTFAPVQGVMVSSEEAGKVAAIAFESNQKVEQGDLLIQQDVSVEKAQLVAAEARAELAKNNFDRAKSLKGVSSLSDKELDDAESNFKQADAEVAQLKAVIERKTIEAPFSGITGIREVQLGQYLATGTPIVSLQTWDPIYVNFSLPQQFLSKLEKGKVVHLSVDAFPDENFEGKITAINAEVDEKTREVELQATVANPEGKLRSGMFVRVAVVLSEGEKYLTIPSTAIRYAPYGNSIYVIERMKGEDGREYLGAKQKFVKLGPARGTQAAVLEGLEEGEEIITSGVFQLRPGAEVKVNNEITPESTPNPQPADS